MSCLTMLIVMLTCRVDHVDEAKANEESSRQEEVGLPDHQHHQIDQHRRPKHHAAHSHAYMQPMTMLASLLAWTTSYGT